MDPSDFDLMARLPLIMKNTNFHEMVRQQLVAEEIPSNQKMDECEFTEFGLSHIPRILPDKDGKKRRTEDRSSSPLRGNWKSAMDEGIVEGQNLSSVMNEKATPGTQQQVLFESSSSFQSRSTNAAACQIAPLIQSRETIHTKMEELACSILMPKPSEINRSQVFRPVQLKRSFERLGSFPNSDSGKAFLPQQDVHDESHNLKNDPHQWAGADESEMKLTIQKLVAALAKFCSDTPRPGTEEWTVFRQQQSDARIQKYMSSNTLEAVNKTAEDKMMAVFERIVVQSVKFAKQIPGFREIDLADQISLIKGSRMEGFVINANRSLNSEVRVVTPVSGIHFTFEELAPLISEEIVDYFMEQSTKSIWQTITEEEQALLVAIILIEGGRSTGLNNPDQIEKILEHLIGCLAYVVKDARNIQERKAELRSALDACRHITTKYRNAMKERLSRVPAHANNLTLNEVL